MKRDRLASPRLLLTSLGALALVAGCIPAPHYVLGDPQTSFPGYDASRGQVGRWVCEQLDFVRVRDAQGDALVELNTDNVARKSTPVAGGGAEFKLRYALLTRTRDLRALVPDDVTQPLVVTTDDWIVGGGIEETHTEHQSCPPAPPIQVIR